MTLTKLFKNAKSSSTEKVEELGISVVEVNPVNGARRPVNVVGALLIVVVCCLPRLKAGVKVVEIPTSVTGCNVVVRVLGAKVLKSGPLVVVKTGLTFNGVVGFDPIDVV